MDQIGEEQKIEQALERLLNRVESNKELENSR